ncbi:hypothetical protein VFMJ11_A0044 [Aliivibrio fischeri MJ11]|uniref:Uncharacterized protein n=1 Tax=Aliivibrio fischeri (strain MJ11) TaxID=388396 RepID=B5ESB2_ALIFM|nr:hypothetical protein [Aliivibrio fischeri]ACH64413.1 hypothetical protein VFMJ11_A0044 [Aliivibrio fischeri MJ11]
MCDLNEDFENLEIKLTKAEIKLLGWDDKEWLIEAMVFIFFICAIITFYCS